MDKMIKREYRCYYEGLQEEMYFNHIANAIKERNSNIAVKFRRIPKLKSLVNASTDVPKIAVFDYDFNQIEFEKNVRLCSKVKIAYTSVNFDLWLLLHKKKYNKVVQSSHAYIDLIRKEYGLNVTTDIKKEENIRKILQQINIEDVKVAINNANQIMKSKVRNDRIIINSQFFYYDNPSMSINEFFEKLFVDIGI